MIIRLIFTIICLVILACFAGFNLDNKCNVNLLVHTFENVPVFVSIIISFAAGVIFTLPFAIFSRKRKNPKEAKAPKENRLKQLKKAEEKTSAIENQTPAQAKEEEKAADFSDSSDNSESPAEIGAEI